MPHIASNRNSALTRVAASLIAATAFAIFAFDVGASAQPTVTSARFTDTTVIDLARDLAMRPYVPPPNTIPKSIADIDYESFQATQFRHELAIGRAGGWPVTVEPLHRGLIYADRIDIAIVKDGIETPLVYSPDMFNFSALYPVLPSDGDIGFSGLRLLADLTHSGFDEYAVFQGASYFRAKATGQGYGLSARGLALKTEQPGQEEFPLFRKFWVEQPAPGHSDIVIDALLDSPSVSGAYRFTVQPGDPTVMQVSATLFPRVDLTSVGLAVGTSMFNYNANGRKNVDDYRPEIHDSDGLLIAEGNGETLWRPLNNPANFSVTHFPDENPRGFGLMQRVRDFADYEDIWAKYEIRPSLFVEPEGNWGKGAVTLVEIPTRTEFYDNIVAYWTPAEPIKGGSAYSFAYRTTWGGEPHDGADVIVTQTRRGQVLSSKPLPNRLFIIDYADVRKAPWVLSGLPTQAPVPVVTGTATTASEIPPILTVSASAGSVYGLVVAPDPRGTGWRIAFSLDPADANPIDLSASLTFADGRRAEVWNYRWTGD